MNLNPNSLETPAADPALWLLDPQVVFLNHGSFGACPRHILEHQREFRDRLERQPIHFFVRDLEKLLDQSRAALAEFIGAKPDNLVFVPNATAGVNTVLRSLTFKPGDELLVTDHEYNACRNALEFVAKRSSAKVVIATVPFPVHSANHIVDCVLSCVTPRTRLVLMDHVTSQTGMIMPVAALIQQLTQRGIDTLVDGAHAPGMIPLHLESLGATYYTGNCHKWLCAPKTVAFLYVQTSRQYLIHPLSISHGHTSPRTDRSRFLIEFAWTGTGDPTPALCLPETLKFIGSLQPGGWEHVMARNRELALDARKIICAALKTNLPCPDDWIGSMASIPISDATEKSLPPLFLDPLQDRLIEKYKIEVPVVPWPAPPKRLIRISAQLYNSLPQYRLLAEALSAET
jgi:isopenicillin-N epimerase